MNSINIKLETIDFWGKAMYKVQDKNIYLTSTTTIFPDKEIAPNGTFEEINNYFREKLDELVIHGSDIEDDTLGTKVKKEIKINII